VQITRIEPQRVGARAQSPQPRNRHLQVNIPHLEPAGTLGIVKCTTGTARAAASASSSSAARATHRTDACADSEPRPADHAHVPADAAAPQPVLGLPGFFLPVKEEDLQHHDEGQQTHANDHTDPEALEAIRWSGHEGQIAAEWQAHQPYCDESPSVFMKSRNDLVSYYHWPTHSKAKANQNDTKYSPEQVQLMRGGSQHALRGPVDAVRHLEARIVRRQGAQPVRDVLVVRENIP